MRMPRTLRVYRKHIHRYNHVCSKDLSHVYIFQHISEYFSCCIFQHIKKGGANSTSSFCNPVCNFISYSFASTYVVRCIPRPTLRRFAISKGHNKINTCGLSSSHHLAKQRSNNRGHLYTPISGYMLKRPGYIDVCRTSIRIMLSENRQSV